MNSRWEFKTYCICISVSQGAGVSRLGGWAAWPQHRHYTPTLDTGHRPHQCTQGNNEDKLHSVHQYIYYSCLGVIYWLCPHTPLFFPLCTDLGPFQISMSTWLINAVVRRSGEEGWRRMGTPMAPYYWIESRNRNMIMGEHLAHNFPNFLLTHLIFWSGSRSRSV